MQPVTLCFDFGNTRFKYAVFEGEELKEVIVPDNGEPASIKAALQRFRPQKTILSSVVNHDPAIEALMREQSRFHLLTHQSKLPFTIPVSKPQTIGADRLAVAAAAVHFFPGKNNLVVALGTCITYNFINKNREFIGGSISPGMDMRFRSLHEFTAKLPLLKEEWNFPAIGYDTNTNIQSGVLLGMAKEIDGIIDIYAQKFSNFNVLLTGGNSAYFVPHLKNQIFADSNLIFKGLYAISECNDQ